MLYSRDPCTSSISKTLTKATTNADLKTLRPVPQLLKKKNKNRRKQNFEDKANNIDRFHKWRPNINYFESIKICLTNFIL